MKKRSIQLIAGLLIILIPVFVSAESAPQEIIDLANIKLSQIGKNPIIIAATKAENAKKKTLEDIQEKDKAWKATPGIVDYMKDLMESECGQYLQIILNSETFYAEIFVMDDQGANVAMTDKTSDYWQGDEAKFKESFNGGEGAVFVDEVEFDDSAQAYLVQVSVPVIDGNKVIGAITFGIDIDKVK